MLPDHRICCLLAFGQRFFRYVKASLAGSWVLIAEGGILVYPHWYICCQRVVRPYHSDPEYACLQFWWNPWQTICQSPGWDMLPLSLIFKLNVPDTAIRKRAIQVDHFQTVQVFVGQRTLFRVQICVWICLLDDTFALTLPKTNHALASRLRWISNRSLLVFCVVSQLNTTVPSDSMAVNEISVTGSGFSNGMK